MAHSSPCRAELAGLDARTTDGGAALLRFSNVTGAVVRDTRLRGAADGFLHVEGGASRRVRLAGHDFSRVSRPVEWGQGVRADAVVQANNVPPR